MVVVPLNAAQSAVTAADAVTAAAIDGLQPPAVWKWFAELSAIPRPSKHEERVLTWLKQWAADRSLTTRSDAVGNLVITRPGSNGGESAPPVVIQGHVDMVCEKNAGTQHDFMQDPIRLRREGDWLMAHDTTLGADNGLGVATALALLDLPRTVKLPPLEALFTVDEETGLTGAFNIDPELVKGRVMLNLDTEDWGEVFIGCAGGGDSQLDLDLPLESTPAGLTATRTLRVSGLLGGHSGLNIHEGRGNALRLLTRALAAVRAAAPSTRVADFAGGDKRNAIPREAQAVLVLAPSEVEAAEKAAAQAGADFIAEFGRLEQALKVDLAPGQAAAPPSHVLQAAGLDRLLALLAVIPHGPVKFSHDMPGLVETSSNLASIAIRPPVSPGAPAVAHIVTSTRSSLGPALEAVRDSIQAAAALSGARMTRGRAYPGWQPRPDASPALDTVVKAYKELNGAAPHVGAIHAGLECGILNEKFPGMDSVSFGPTIKGAHSPDERVQVSTVPPFWELTLRVLEHLADKRA